MINERIKRKSIPDRALNLNVKKSPNVEIPDTQPVEYFIAGETISDDSLVYLLNGLAYQSDADNPKADYICIEGGDADDRIICQRTGRYSNEGEGDLWNIEGSISNIAPSEIQSWQFLGKRISPYEVELDFSEYFIYI